MKRTKSAIVMLLTSAAFFSMSQTASAAPCSAEVTALKTELTSGICSYSKKCKGLSHKLDNVNRKLEKGEFSHAGRKLSDFGAIVEDMAMRKKPKISMDDYESLMVQFYNPAANCVSNGGVVVADANPNYEGSGADVFGSGILPDETPGSEPTGVQY